MARWFRFSIGAMWAIINGLALNYVRKPKQPTLKRKGSFKKHLPISSCKNNYCWLAMCHNLVDLDQMVGKILLFVLSNIMNSLDVALCHIVD